MSTTDLLVVDSLQGLTCAPPIATTRLNEAVVPLSLAGVVERLTTWQRDFADAQADATVKAVRADWGQYIRYCEGTGQAPLPASLEQLHDFLINAIERGRKRTTVSRYLYTVSLIHDAAGLPNPAKHRRWPLMWKALGKKMKESGAGYRKQAGALVESDVERILATMGDAPRDLRDAAMLSLASDSLLREAELVAVQLAHLRPDPAEDGWSVWVPSSKTDQTGEGDDFRYVSDDTLARLRRWTEASGISEGYIFLPIGGRKRAAVKAAELELRPIPVLPLQPDAVARIFRQRALAAGLKKGWTITGHSTRIGTANDLMRNGSTIGQIKHAGGWKSDVMVHAYTRRSKAGQNAVHKLRQARKQSAGDGE